MTTHTFGWRPGLQDQRDFKFSSIRTAVELPKSIDLRNRCSAVEDQGNIGSCTANAAIGILEFLDAVPDNTYVNLSRLFLYYNTRLLEGTQSYDSGCTIRGTFKALNRYGVCPESRWPYTISKYKTKPNATSYKDALRRVVKSYYSVRTLGEIKASLAQGKPVMFGFTVYEGFDSEEVARTGVAEMPGMNEAVLGGHAVLAVGYDDATSRLIVRNSWGVEWGQKGYFTMPYEFVTSKMAEDFWTVA